MEKLMGFVLLILGLFIWINFWLSQQFFCQTLSLYANNYQSFGKWAANGFFIGTHILPIPFGLLMLHKRKPRPPLGKK